MLVTYVGQNASSQLDMDQGEGLATNSYLLQTDDRIHFSPTDAYGDLTLPH